MRTVFVGVLVALLLPAPAGAAIAFAHGGSVWSADAAGGQRVRLAHGSQPAWSPDGRRIAFMRNGSSELWTMRADGSHRRRLVPHARHRWISSPAWSGDGRRLAFTTVHIGPRDYQSAVQTVRRDGARRRTVVRLKGFRVIGAVTWGPHALFYTRAHARSPIIADIRRIDPDGHGDRLFLADAEQPSWSPDGRHVAFGDLRRTRPQSCGSDECEVNADLAIADARGHHRRLLTHTHAAATGAAWSPDGTRIAFASGRNLPPQDFTGDEIYTIKPDGSCLTWLTNGTPESASPSWSPGSAVAGCGRRRAAVVEVQPRGGVWLGPRLGAALLDHVQGAGRETLLSYEDCSAFSPGGCPPAFLLDEHDACNPSSVPVLDPLHRTGGALFFRYSTFLIGHHLIFIQFDTPSTRRQKRALRHRIAAGLRSVSGRPIGPPTLAAKRRAALPRRLRMHVRAC